MKKDKMTVPGRIRKGLIYGICMILALFYMLVLWWGKNPDVGIEYRMYYLTHELSDWPGYGKLAYTLGTDEYCTGLKDRNGRDVAYKVCRRKGQGWEKEAYEGSVNKGTESWIYYLPDTTQKEVLFTVECNQFSGSGNVEVYTDSLHIGTIQAAGTYTFVVPEVIADQLLSIRFDAKNSEFRVWRVRLG